MVTSSPRRRPAIDLGLAAIVALAFVVRMAALLTTSGFHPIDDSATYDRMASSLASTGSLPSTPIPPFHGATAYPPPGFPALLALPYKLVGAADAHTRWDSGRVLEVLLGTLTVLLCGWLGRALFGRRGGWLAAGIAAIYPPLILIGTSLMSESLFVPLTLAAALCALRGRSAAHPLRWAVGCGLLIALAGLTHGNGIALLLPCGALLVGTARGAGRGRRAALRAPATMLAVCLVVLAPWAIRNTSQFGQFVPITTEDGYALAGTYSSAADHARDTTIWVAPFPQIVQALDRDSHLNEAQMSDRLRSDALRYIRAHPTYPLKVALWSTLRLLNLSGPAFERRQAPIEGFPRGLTEASVYAFWAVGLLALVGVAAGAWRRAPLALWGVPAIILLTAIPFAGLTRYRSPADPFLIALAAGGLLALGGLRDRHGLPSAAA